MPLSVKDGPQVEEGMAGHPSTLARRIPGTEEPGGLQSTGSQGVGHVAQSWTTGPVSAPEVWASVRPNCRAVVSAGAVERARPRVAQTAGPGCRAPTQACFALQVIHALGQAWHPEHFVCAHCKGEIGASPFFERSGLAYCAEDYHRLFSPRCAYCAAPILDVSEPPPRPPSRSSAAS